MLAWITNNISFGRTIVALLLSVVVWGYVIITQYPEESIPFNNLPLQTIGLPVTLVTRPISPSVVKVTINGAKDKINLVQPVALHPTIDLSVCNKAGTCDVKVKLNPLPEFVASYSVEPEIIQVQLEDLVTKDLVIQTNKVGTVKLGYQQPDEIKLAQNIVTVSGPKSLVDRVNKAQVTVDLQDKESNIQGRVDIVLLDAQGQPVVDKSLKTIPSGVDVSVTISFRLNSKTVPVRVTTTGAPAAGYVAGSSLSTDPTFITLNGDPVELGKVDAVQTKPVSLNNATSDIITTVQLQQPENTVIIGSRDVKVVIGITVAQASVPVNIPVEVVNADPALRFQVNPKEASITLTGAYPLLVPKLPLDQIKATVDLTGKGTGTFEVPLQVQTPPGIIASNFPKISVTLVTPPRPTVTATSSSTATPLPATATPSPTPTVTPVNLEPSPTSGTPASANPGPTSTPKPPGNVGSPVLSTSDSPLAIPQVSPQVPKTIPVPPSNSPKPTPSKAPGYMPRELGLN